MSVKHYEVAGLGPVAFYKRRGTRHLRITLTAAGAIKVSMPPWAPYRLAIEFVKNKQAWVDKHRMLPQFLKDGQAIGKAHHLEFVPQNTTTRPSGRLSGNAVRVSYSASLAPTEPNVQQAAQRSALKALQKEATALLPNRLAMLAAQHGFSYKSLRIKHLRSKWGSCNHHQEITLNSFLMTLPWELIDYVMVHELVHTKVLRHGEPFWTEMERYLPNTQALRKRTKLYQPTFHAL